MALEHPIDAEIRAWLERHVQNQKELSVSVGHGTSWLHKYVNGAGHATIDDLVRIAGVLFGMNLPVLSGLEQRLLKAWRAIPDAARQEDAVVVFENIAKGYRRGKPQESTAPAAHTPPAKVRKGHGKQ